MVSKTKELRKVVTALLKQVNEKVFYEDADDETPYPYIVYEFNTIDLGNEGRDDVILIVNAWDKGRTAEQVEALADNIENALNGTNSPTKTVLPTFYLFNRDTIRDEDKSIKRRELKFEIQNYYIGG